MVADEAIALAHLQLPSFASHLAMSMLVHHPVSEATSSAYLQAQCRCD
jgi:hypothetical protein